MEYNVLPCREGVWSIEEGFVRCFLIEGTEKALLLDTCMGQGDLESCVRGLTGLPVTVAHTHADGDHTGGDGPFGEIALHEADWSRYLENHPADAPHTFLKDGQVLDLGGVELEAIHIPGHTPGSVAFLDRRRRMIFTGDTVQRDDPVFLFGPGRDLPRYIESLRLLCARAGEFDTIYTCHGELCVPAAYLEDILSAAEALRDGKLTSAPADEPFPGRVYSQGRTRFLFP